MLTPPLFIYYWISTNISIEDSIEKGGTKTTGETNSVWLNITGFSQSIPTTSEEWIAALSDTTTKKTLDYLFASYVKSGQTSLFYPTTVNDEDITWQTDPKSGMLSEEFVCNHEEADTRIIYHASLQKNSDVVFVANHSDVLFHAVYGCALDSNRNWYYNYEATTYANLAIIANFYGDNSIYLLMLHFCSTL